MHAYNTHVHNTKRQPSGLVWPGPRECNGHVRIRIHRGVVILWVRNRRRRRALVLEHVGRRTSTIRCAIHRPICMPHRDRNRVSENQTDAAAYTYTHVHVHTQLPTYLHTYIHAHTYIHTYIQTHSGGSVCVPPCVSSQSSGSSLSLSPIAVPSILTDFSLLPEYSTSRTRRWHGTVHRPTQTYRWSA
jgi:hypothetical protein